jgi:hypothetical protein
MKWNVSLLIFHASACETSKLWFNFLNNFAISQPIGLTVRKVSEFFNNSRFALNRSPAYLLFLMSVILHSDGLRGKVTGTV